MKFGMIIEKYEDDRKEVLDALEISLPKAGMDYYEDEFASKEAKNIVKELKKAISLQKKDVAMWKKKKGNNIDNIEAAEGILGDLEAKKAYWEKAQEKPEEPEPVPPPEGEEPSPEGEEPPERPEPYPGTEIDGKNEPKEEIEPQLL